MKLTKLLIPPAVFYLIRSLKRRITKYYTIGDFTLKLSPGHLLPEFQTQHRLYDRFLPYLTKHLGSDNTIIDVGANIGDTAYLIADAFEGKIVCIEGSNRFYKYLTDNTENLPPAKRENITCVKALVSQAKNKGNLKHINGTAKFVKGDNQPTDVESDTLDNLLANISNIKLIKVDTDGYDHDVLLSGKDTIKKFKPILFWENVIENDQQLSDYQHLYNELESLGYSKVYIFDNFGNLMFSDNKFDSLFSICEYVYTIQEHGDHRTISYTDTLAVTADDEEWIDRIIEGYKKDMINTQKT